jgi:histidinol-phosphate/aromatic aminotransferase/cobyric acid decarboxylase-like protein
MIVRRLEDRLDWQLEIPFRPPAAAYHGGAFFVAIGERFDHLDRCREIISADVLDAWFPPSPKAVKSLREYLPWLIATSPPTHAAGLVETIAERRGVRPENIFVGAGSSDLIYLALRQWLGRNSKVLILDPTYGEYPHILRNVLGCHVDPFILQRETNYRVDLQRLGDALKRDYNLVVLVNPNSPTGQHIQRELLESVLVKAHENTRVWVDETYVDYVDPGQSLERFAVRRPNVIVCKSMSKVYALSGVRSAYLCGPAHQLEQLRGIAPPWAVSLPAQVAAVNALNDPEYYLTRYGETHKLRERLARELASMGWDVLPGCANFLLVHLSAEGPTATEWVDACRERGLHLRNAAGMSARFGDHALRVAVKDAATNRRMLKILRSVRPW